MMEPLGPRPNDGALPATFGANPGVLRPARFVGTPDAIGEVRPGSRVDAARWRADLDVAVDGTVPGRA